MHRSSAPNALYAQSGGVSAVINASMVGVIEAVRAHPAHFNRIYGALNGIWGALHEHLVDLTDLPDTALQQLLHLPGAALQACRFDIDPLDENPGQYERLLNVFRAHRIGYFFYNGGNGSMLTATRLAEYCRSHGHPLQVIGIPKTIDNDLEGVDFSPGYGSAAKYVATSLLEATLDLRAMHPTATKVFIMETMGRDTGWLTLAAGLVADRLPDTPFILLFPERPFIYEKVLEQVRGALRMADHCVIVVSEGIRQKDGSLFAAVRPNSLHAGWTQLGGASCKLADWLRRDLDCKVHAAIPDYLQRSAVHLRARSDWEVARAVGQAAVELAVEGAHGVLPGIVRRTEGGHVHWTYRPALEIADLANAERRVPDAFIHPDGYGITPAAKEWLQPLVEGPPPAISWQGALPDYTLPHLPAVPRQLPPWPHDLLQRCGGTQH